MFGSALIIFRETLEAALVIGIIAVLATIILVAVSAAKAKAEDTRRVSG